LSRTREKETGSSPDIGKKPGGTQEKKGGIPRYTVSIGERKKGGDCPQCARFQTLLARVGGKREKEGLRVGGKKRGRKRRIQHALSQQAGKRKKEE